VINDCCSRRRNAQHNNYSE